MCDSLIKILNDISISFNDNDEIKYRFMKLLFDLEREIILDFNECFKNAITKKYKGDNIKIILK